VRARGLVFAFVVAMVAVAACSSPSPPALLVLHFDAGSDARADAALDAGGTHRPTIEILPNWYF